MVAVSDSRSGLYNPNGLDVAAAVAHKGETGALEGLRGADAITTASCCSSTDVLAPCALEQVISSENADRVKASIVLEGANGPITPTARTRSSKTGACWSCPTSSPTPAGSSSPTSMGPGAAEYFWKIDEVNAKLNDITTRAFRETWDLREARGTTMRLAATGSRCSGSARRRRRAACIRRRGRCRTPLSCTPPAAAISERARRTVHEVRAGRASTSRRWTSPGTTSWNGGFRELIPVVEIDGETAFTFFVHEAALRRKWVHKLGSAGQACNCLLQGETRAGRIVRHCYKHPNKRECGSARSASPPASATTCKVLTQARKMGKERISSQEISDYTNINATQIRRDLSAFGKFGKRASVARSTAC